jgi:alkane 1-monooxygenase
MQPSVSDTPDAGWKDKRWLWLWSPAVPVVFGSSLLAFAWSGHWAWLLYAPVFIHLVLPVLDTVFGEDFSNPPESAVAQLEQDGFYRALVWAYVPFQLAGTVLGAWLAATHDLPWYAFAALVVSVGSFNGIGIGTAHELGHKKEATDRWLSKLALAPSLYGHFYVEHNRGHHRWVATPQDPASSRMGESIYRFALRELPGGRLSVALSKPDAAETQVRSVTLTIDGTRIIFDLPEGKEAGRSLLTRRTRHGK